MEAKERRKNISLLRRTQDNYLDTVKSSSSYVLLQNDFKSLSIKLQKLLRKVPVSEHSFNSIAPISQLIFAIRENIKKKVLPPYTFTLELKWINHYLTEYLTSKIKGNYNGKCGYGESLLNAYLDVFVRASILKLDRQISAHPVFLVNPITGQHLEMDVFFEDFKLGFELQGHEYHYSDPATINKDSEKLKLTRANNSILIPINNIQLNSTKLQELIINTLQVFLGIGDIFKLNSPIEAATVKVSKKQLMQFSKIAQRLFLSEILYKDTLVFLDALAEKYRTTQLQKRPAGISNTGNAPTFVPIAERYDIDTIYRNLRYVTSLRKQ